MIRIHRPKKVPDHLRKRARSATKKLLQAFDSGEMEFDFDREVYGEASVKEALRLAQYGKCCFCESPVGHISPGDVEHFRPKAGYRQAPGGTLQRPGYYWLAYEWTNLLFCCPLCNQRHKQNLFPLLNPKRRAVSHHHDLALERPVFINPATEEPARYIAFRGEYAHPIRNNRRGRETIAAIGLNRPQLLERRWDHLDKINLLKDARSRLVRDAKKLASAGEALSAQDQESLQKLDVLFQQLKHDSAEYAAMARAALA